MNGNTPPDRGFVTLAHALSWIAFGDWFNSEDHWKSYADGKQRLEMALEKLCNAACAGTLELRGRLVPKHDADPRRFDTSVIPAERLHDFRQYDQMHCGLRVGAGLFGFAEENAHGFTFAHQPIVREDFYRDVWVRKEQLASVFRRSASTVKTTAKAGKDCTDWLEQEFARDPEHRLTKAEFRSKALASIKGLSGRGFDRAWSSVAPSSGRTASGRKKSSH